MDRVLEYMIIIICVAKFLLKTSRVLKGIELCKECLIHLKNKAFDKPLQELVNVSYIALYRTMFKGYRLINDHPRAIECCRNLLVIVRGRRDELEGEVLLELATFYHDQSNYEEAKSLYEETVNIVIETGERRREGTCYGNLGTVFYCIGEYAKAKEYLHKALTIRKELGDRKKEASCYGNLATVFQSLSEYEKAKEYLEKSLAISKELGDREGEAFCYGNLGTVFQSLSEYNKAEEYLQKALVIRNETGDRKGEAAAYANLGTVFSCRGQYDKAIEYFKKGLAIHKEMGDRHGEAADDGNLGSVFTCLGEYAKAEEFLQKGLAISKEIGSREGEAAAYGRLGNVFQALGEYTKAEEYLQKSIPIRIEICDRHGQAADYGSLGTVFCFRSEYAKAEKYLQKSLAIREKIGDRYGEASCYGRLGPVFRLIGEFVKAEEYLQKALVIRKEIGDRQGEAEDYTNLFYVLRCVGEHVKAEEYLQKAITIFKEIGDRRGEASSYEGRGITFRRLGEYAKAEECFQKSLTIREKLGDRDGEAACYRNLGTLFLYFGECGKAEKYIQKALAITKKIGDRNGEAEDYRNLGNVFQYIGESTKAREYHEKALALSKEIGDIESEFLCFFELAHDTLLERNVEGAVLNLLASICTCEDMRNFLRENDQFKSSFLDVGYDSSYRMLSELLFVSGNPNEALYFVELGRARALADLMSAQYSVQQISASSQSWKRILQKENFFTCTGCSCLYISYVDEKLLLWILKANKPILSRKIDANNCLDIKGSVVRRNVNDIFGNETFRRFHVLPEERCEDRSLFSSSVSLSTQKPTQKDEALRLVEEEDEENQQPDPSLNQCYKMLITRVADLLDEPEIIVVPDRSLYKVPFPALSDESGKYLSESFRIRIVPSLTTLKLIQDSPADYHSQTGALIVGEPKVSQVFYKGTIENLCPLPSARKEAEMIGRLLGVQPLLGQQATKLAVLQSIHSVGLIHFAAHGNAERGEIALAPLGPANVIPQEEEYLLSMADIAQVRLQAKLVVLSCCHSARGQIRSEGVIGIARAFLGSGARSVLVALWALEDKATEQFMSCFYEHLVRGESASESVHEAMKWMRGNGYSDVGQWAPFMLIGDNVSFDFGK